MATPDDELRRATVELLEKSAVMLLESGWTRRVYRDAAGRHCAVGALSDATAEMPETISRMAVFNIAAQEVAKYLGATGLSKVSPQTQLTKWNDALDAANGAIKVVNTFRAVARKLQEG